MCNTIIHNFSRKFKIRNKIGKLYHHKSRRSRGKAMRLIKSSIKIQKLFADRFRYR
jgi:hypothetical protein